MPLYIDFILFLGALFSYSIILSILTLSGIILPHDAISFTVPGVIFIAVSLGIYFSTKRVGSLMLSFSQQLSLLFMVTGKLFLVTAVYLKFNSLWGITFALGALSLLTYFFYENKIDRFIFMFLFLCSIYLNITPHSSDTTLLSFYYFTLILAFTFLLFAQNKLTQTWTPIFYAFIFSIIFIVNMISAAPLLFDKPLSSSTLFIFNLSLSVFIMGLILYSAKSLKTMQTLPIVFSCVGIFILSFISNLGILWGIALLIMGYQNNKLILNVIGALFLIFFITFYYYTLSLPLDYKSFLLMGNGVFLLLIRATMKYLKWDKL